MKDAALGYDSAQLRALLEGPEGAQRRFPHLELLARCPSTNDVARQRAREGAADGTVVLANAQTAGRGRLQREWLSLPERGVYVSILLRPRLPLASWGLLPLATGLAGAEALGELEVPDVDVKWPNDLRCRGRKIAGILCEQSGGAVIVGLGLNVGHRREEFPGELRDIATSIFLATGRLLPREQVVAALLRRFAALLDGWEQDGTFPWERWRRLSAVEGRRVYVDGPAGRIEGTALSVDPDGALRLRVAGGEELRVLAGDVSLREAR